MRGASIAAGLAGMLLLGNLGTALAVGPAVAGERRVTLHGQELEVTWDEATRAPLTISAPGGDLIAVKNAAALTRKEINDIGALLAVKYGPLLRVRPDELVLATAEKTGGSWYASFRQTFHGMAVHDSSLGFSIGADGRIRSLGALLHPDIPAPAAIKVDRMDALKTARIHIRETEKGTYRVAAESLAIYPERNAGSIDYRRVYIFNLFPGDPAHPASAVGGYAVFVDAATGKVVRTQPVLKPLGCCLPAEGFPAVR